MVLSTTLIIQIAIPVILVIISWLAKKFPKEKISRFFMPACVNFGRLISKFCIVRFGKSGLDNVGEGIIVTLLDVMSNCLSYIVVGIMEHNSELIDKANIQIDKANTQIDKENIKIDKENVKIDKANVAVDEIKKE
jgi:hypothetical protein